MQPTKSPTPETAAQTSSRVGGRTGDVAAAAMDPLVKNSTPISTTKWAASSESINAPWDADILFQKDLNPQNKKKALSFPNTERDEGSRRRKRKRALLSFNNNEDVKAPGE
jgi:hypothetical protein